MTKNIRDKIQKYLSVEKAYKPRYKHLGGQHPQKRHGFRGSESGAVIPEGASEQDAYDYAGYILRHKPGDPLPTEGARQLAERVFDIGGFETYGDWARDTITKVNLHNLFTSDHGILTDKDRQKLREVAKINEGFDNYTIKLVKPMKEEEMNPSALEHEWGISKYGIRMVGTNYIGVGSWDIVGPGKWVINIAKNSESYGMSKRSIFWHEFGHTVGDYIIKKFIGEKLPTETYGSYVDRFSDAMTG
jgi:hypothetical protein